mmetsp:Transcript_25491/g.55438  ORF Transcript_25491/g.55438 Transcript_25491/m.55438 type:complete len:341 (+) Transcript_25491:306-1328(+)|eukprot:CAMPEP_0202891912 /NCGR_PEP_ID=MMETSP1392-20130828/1827_1 /ASSEMBLY_ACC=CAM_ASM_000868 /TAXON_ID=225041 /ORGANISM="Chlamydomonas chlamydogama, Strain SAG 11-48b" /LENGTH=340 /DNA_ID=CAMNT_0049575779 /DNA_START=302 /DNA_END=1324 /DNA_ORIENTATION=+
MDSSCLSGGISVAQPLETDPESRNIDDYRFTRYLRLKREVKVPVPDFTAAFSEGLRHDVTTLFLSSLLDESSDDEDTITVDVRPSKTRLSAKTHLIEKCERRCMVAWLTPRMACKLFWHGLRLCQQMEVEGPAVVASSLPIIVHPYLQDQSWWDAFEQSLKRILSRLAWGRSPDPNCNGEVMAWHILLKFTQSAEDSGQDADVHRKLRALPSHRLDSDFDLMRDLALSDYDVFMLFECQKHQTRTQATPSRSSSILSPSPSSPSSSRSGWLSSTTNSTATSPQPHSLRTSSEGSRPASCMPAPAPLDLPPQEERMLRARYLLHPTEWFRAFDIERMDDHM